MVFSVSYDSVNIGCILCSLSILFVVISLGLVFLFLSSKPPFLLLSIHGCLLLNFFLVMPANKAALAPNSFVPTPYGVYAQAQAFIDGVVLP